MIGVADRCRSICHGSGCPSRAKAAPEPIAMAVATVAQGDGGQT